jgi:formylglycine-generating enzyme required for sulfatase activity
LERRLRRIPRSIAILSAMVLFQCQLVGGFEDFEAAPPPPPSQCAALPAVKEDALGLGLMTRIDIPNSTCFWIDQKEVTVEDYQRWQAAVPDESVEFESEWCKWKQTRSDPIADENDSCALQRLAFDLQPFASQKPMRCVDFCDAEGFCRWSGKHLCHSTDAFGVQGPRNAVREWLLACSNALGTAYPWGNEPEAQRCNTGQSVDNCITSRAVCGPLPVGEKTQCRTASGVSDLLGNVAEWVYSCNLVGPDQDTPTGCLVRGGGYDEPLQACVQETTLQNDTRLPSLGFRCCSDLTPDEELQLANVNR